MWIPTEEEKIGVGELIAPLIVNLQRLVFSFLNPLLAYGVVMAVFARGTPRFVHRHPAEATQSIFLLLCLLHPVKNTYT